MSNQTKHPSVLITGASTGLGAACALEMDRLGWRVYAGVRTQEAGKQLADSARAIGNESRIVPIIIDVTNKESIAAAANTIEQTVGPDGLDALVNNAGIAVSGPLEIVAIERIRHQLEVNLIGQVAVTQAMLPMLRVARGRIVNMGSVSGLVASPFLGPYCMSKFALEAFSDSLRVELAHWGISVSLVEPVSIKSDIWEKAQEDIERLKAEATPEGRELYSDVIEKMSQVISESERTALPVEKVTRAVRHALTARRAKTRYLVSLPLGKLLFPLFRVMPDRMRDWILRRIIK
ncbi:MAG: SDR family oxidoreductase [Pirellulales bacterium]|nr:SDR family oxidoreductase [Pirellulales bacterium]